MASPLASEALVGASDRVGGLVNQGGVPATCIGFVSNMHRHKQSAISNFYLVDSTHSAHRDFVHGIDFLPSRFKFDVLVENHVAPDVKMPKVWFHGRTP